MMLASLILLSYNQREYIDAALDSVFSQTHSPLQIVVADDGSTDGTYEVLVSRIEAYAGSHSVTLLPRQANAGLIGNLNRALSHASGELVVVAAGDDISHTNRVAKLVTVFLQNEKPMLIHSKARVMDANGRLTEQEEPPHRLRSAMPAKAACSELSIYLGATAAWGRSLLDAFDPISEPEAFEDLVMGFRASLHDSVIYHDEALVDYRVGNGMSQQTPTTFDAYVKRRRKMLRVNLAVYRQRLSDVQKTRHAPAELANQLRGLISTEQGRNAFYEPTAISGNIQSRLRFLRGWLDECRKHLKNRLKFGFRNKRYVS